MLHKRITVLPPPSSIITMSNGTWNVKTTPLSSSDPGSHQTRRSSADHVDAYAASAKTKISVRAASHNQTRRSCADHVSTTATTGVLWAMPPVTKFERQTSAASHATSQTLPTMPQRRNTVAQQQPSAALTALALPSFNRHSSAPVVPKRKDSMMSLMED